MSAQQDHFIDIVFDGPPAHESGRFVEVENSSGASISIGEWIKRDDSYWVLRIPSDFRPALELQPAESIALTVAISQLQRGELPMPGIAATCVIALARITGRKS